MPNGELQTAAPDRFQALYEAMVLRNPGFLESKGIADAESFRQSMSDPDLRRQTYLQSSSSRIRLGTSGSYSEFNTMLGFNEPKAGAIRQGVREIMEKAPGIEQA